MIKIRIVSQNHKIVIARSFFSLDINAKSYLVNIRRGSGKQSMTHAC